MDKTLLKYFLVLSFLFLFIFNWGYIDWFFNYKAIGENLGYLSRKVFGQNEVSVYFSEIASLASSTAQVQLRSKSADITKPSYVRMPSIGVNAPISFTQSSSQQVFNNFLNYGTLHYPDSALPGEVGTAIILGHSAPPNWPKIKYDSVFNDLEDLKPGDEILIDFQGESYKYLVKDTFFVKRGQDLSKYLTFNKSMLLLVSCWPPGHNLQRIVVEAELDTN